jgi:enoyl-CoA hydratase
MPEQSYEKLTFGRDSAVTTITLNRPKVHNALDKQLSDELNRAVRAVRDDRACRVLILRGAGDTFCAGDDLREFNEWTEDDGYWQVRLYQETVQIIENLTAITIAAVDGMCAGGGLELTLVCDFVIATDRSRWGMPEIDWDITPGWGAISRLSRFAGRRKAKEWNLIGAFRREYRGALQSLQSPLRSGSARRGSRRAVRSASDQAPAYDASNEICAEQELRYTG